MDKRALITGVNGMDGSHLADLLLSKGYEVHGIIRRQSVPHTPNIDHLRANDKFFVHYGDVTDGPRMCQLVYIIVPTEIYNLAAQSHAGISYKNVRYTLDSTGTAVGILLEAMRHFAPGAKFWQASSTEMFDGNDIPYNEDSKMVPGNPYGAAKMLGHELVRMYRDTYNLFACSGIMSNHESERRGEEFVTRKITKAVAMIKAGKQDKLLMGNLEAKRDWGYAPEFMEGAWMMLQADKPKDYMLATGEAHSVREWLEAAFGCVAIDPYKYYEEYAKFMRPSDQPILVGDASLIKSELDWEAKTRYKKLVKIMVDHDMSILNGNSNG